MTPKNKKIIEDSERLGIPIFVLTAKDAAAIQTLHDYVVNCSILGCNQAHIDGVENRIDEFELWIAENIASVKIPD